MVYHPGTLLEECEQGLTDGSHAAGRRYAEFRALELFDLDLDRVNRWIAIAGVAAAVRRSLIYWIGRTTAVFACMDGVGRYITTGV